MIWLTVFIYHLIVYEYVFRSVKASWRSKRTVVGTYPVCPRGCTACSRVNGCITCEGSLFMFLYRHNMRETGICTPSCPVGYYGVRHQYYSKCYRCHIDHCHSCFDRNFCTVCDQPYLAIEGQCLEECPEGLYYANYTRECKERVDCLPGAWSPWSTCMRNGQTCGYRWGTQTRTQEILQDPSPNGTPCPEVTPTQRCRLRRRQCDEAHNGGFLASRWSRLQSGPAGCVDVSLLLLSTVYCTDAPMHADDNYASVITLVIQTSVVLHLLARSIEISVLWWCIEHARCIL